MKIISYAQNHEDILLNRVFAGRDDGFYIDVGACHPVFHSVTKFFYERGWRGVNVEPIPRIFDVLAADRPRDVNLPIGLSNREGTLLFHEVPAELGSSTFSSQQAADLRHRGLDLVGHQIPVTTLARVCEEYAPETIDFLKIDVESHEREVLEGADWSRFRPRVVLIEATRPSTPIPCHDEWESLLLSADYLFAFFDGLNRYYVRAEDRELLPLLTVPPNIFDNFESYEHHDQVLHLQNQVEHRRQELEQHQRELERVRRWGEGLEQAIAGHEQTIAGLEETRHQLGRDLQSTKGELDRTLAALGATRISLGDLQCRYDAMQADLETARARLALFEGWGPMTVSVVRRLRALSLRLRLVKPLLRRAIEMRRGLLTALAAGQGPR